MSTTGAESTDTKRVGRLALLSAGLTFLLIVLGGYVRISDSGLGCGPAGSGAKGWPLCDGRLLPLLDTGTLIEYSHRAVAGLTAIAVLVLLILVWLHMRKNRRALMLSVAAGVVVLVQAVLGGLTVEENLHELLVAVHLGLAMILLALLLGVYGSVRRSSAGLGDRSSLLKPLVTLTAVLLLATIVAGGYVSGTEGHGREEHVFGGGAHLACGKQFPACQGKFLPFGISRLVDIQLAHRLLVYITTALLLVLFAYILIRARRRWLVIYGSIGFGLLVVQFMLGALNVWLGEHAALVILHLLAGTLLWSWIVLLLLRLIAVPQEEPVRLRSEGLKAVTT